MSQITRIVGQRCLLRCNAGLLFKRTLPTAATPYDKMKEFWATNKKLNRPLSPHLTIYSPQLTSMLSITHRATGMGLSIALSTLAISSLVLPYNFTHYLTLVNDLHLPPIIIGAAKFTFAFPLTYHFLNGIRHLAWDMGKGYNLNVLYQSGWVVLASSFALSLFFVLFQ